MISSLDDCVTSTDEVAPIPADVVNVGRGINGVPIGFDVVDRRCRTVLVERDDLGVGTSSRPFKLIHGGLRYHLEHHEFRPAREARGEGHLLATTLAPHLGAAPANRVGVTECTRANGRVTGVVAFPRDALDRDLTQRSVTIDDCPGSVRTEAGVPGTVERSKVKG